MRFPHAAIERLHPQGVPSLGPAREIRARAEETVVLAKLDGHRQVITPSLHHLPDAPLAGLGDDDPVGFVPRDRSLEFSGERAGIARRIEAHIVDGDALGLQIGREMAHGREQESDLLLVVADIGRLLPHLDHENGVGVRVEIGERGNAAVKLIAEDEAERALAGHPFVRRAERPPSAPMI